MYEHLARSGECTWLSVDSATHPDLHLTAHHWVGQTPYCKCGQVRKP